MLKWIVQTRIVLWCVFLFISFSYFPLKSDLLRYYFRKFFHAPVLFLDDPRATGQPAPLNWNTLPQQEVTEHQGPISVRTFGKHVAELHADGDIGFSKEYEVIQSNQDQHVSEQSQMPENRVKNRYLNIIACKMLFI